MKTIVTTYTPKKGAQPETVYWLPRLRDGYFSASQYERHAYSIPAELKRFYERIDNLTIAGIELHAVTVNEFEEGNWNRTIMRGYKPYSYGHAQEPVAPLFVRGVPLPEIKATVQFGHGEGAFLVHINADYGMLTPGQRKSLEEWFANQILSALTPQLLAELKAQAKEAAVRDASDYLAKRMSEAEKAIKALPFP